MKQKNNNGFTLIELLAVIVVLTIILAIAIPGISGIINSASKGSFESDAKMLLKAVDYKKLEDEDFDMSTINKENMSDILGLASDNYGSVNVTLYEGVTILSVIGVNKWAGLIACGTYQNMKIVESINNCGDVVSPVISVVGDNPVMIDAGTTYTDAGATAIDNLDGVITSEIVVTSSLDLNVAGTYTITYEVEDIAGNKMIANRTVIVKPGYNFAKGVNMPVLAPGMTPIKWSGTSWVETTEGDTNWYSYKTTDKKWANAHTEDGSMWVWIPRYIYMISTGWHSTTTGTVNAQFSIGEDDTRRGAVSITNSGKSNDSNGAWTNHPAFTFGDTQLTGIWVAKFEASGTTSAVNFVPNVESLRSTTLNSMFTTSRNMEINSLYGWGTTGNNIDTHLIKNSEWGAASYLAKSAFGKNADIWINNSLTFITGCAGNSASEATYDGCQNQYNTTNGVQASTTGNIYGIYDMSGGAWEHTAAYVDNGNAILNLYGSSIISADAKYKDVYAMGATDTYANNYNLAINKKGDAVYETSASGTASTSWNSDYSYMPRVEYPWFLRSGSYYNTGRAGTFYFSYGSGSADAANGFRVVLLVSEGL